MADFRHLWIVLELETQGTSVQCSYRDGLGRRFRATIRSRPAEFVLPSQAITYMTDLLSGLPLGRRGPHNTGPVPLPIFVGLGPVGDEATLLRNISQSTVQRGINADRVQVCRLTKLSGPRRPLFRLPFHILAVGPPGDFGLDVISGQHWFTRNQLVQTAGIRIETTSRELLLKALTEAPRDVLFVQAFGRSEVNFIGSLPMNSRPRLIVHFSENPPKIAEGVSVIQISDLSTRKIVGTEIVYCLIHDLPLHETVKSTQRTLKFSTEPILYSNPVSNNDLRIIDSLRFLKANAVEFQSKYSAITPATLDRFKITAPRLYELFSKHADTISRVHETATAVRSNPVNFRQESTGLGPLVEAQANFEQVVAESAPLGFQLANLRRDPEVGRILAKEQQRYVDVALERLDTDPFLLTVERTQSLQSGASYQLRVHIGNQLPGSLVRGKPKPIDPLLPPLRKADGHWLDIAIQRKEFSLLTRCRKSVLLPRLGSSRPKYFMIRAPRRLGPATLRILVYYRNYLLQSFLLSSEITESEQSQSHSVTHVDPEYSKTTRYTNLDQLKPRKLSIGANRGIDGTHELFIKGVQAGSVPLGDRAFTDAMNEIRDILLAATVDQNDPNIARCYPALAQGQTASDEFSSVIRQLADKGHDIYTAFFRSARSSRTLLTSLRDLRESDNETIQIVRLSERAVIPWSMLYDFEPPQTSGGAVEVCLGTKSRASGAFRQCSHKAQDKVYCVRGFWGVRHYVEELIGAGPQDDAITSISRPNSSKPICMAIDMTVPGATELCTGLATDLGNNTIRTRIRADELLDLLWQKPPERPTVLIILGHFETGAPRISNEPKGERIVLEKDRDWITHQSISDKYIASGEVWEQPRSLVLLMACASAITSVDKINDFVLALNAAGAGAIVGTECVVFSDLACKFAQSLTTHLWKDRDAGKAISFGRAMKDFRVSLLQTGNPLAFVFRSIGDADLILQG